MLQSCYISFTLREYLNCRVKMASETAMVSCRVQVKFEPFVYMELFPYNHADNFTLKARVYIVLI